MTTRQSLVPHPVGRCTFHQVILQPAKVNEPKLQAARIVALEMERMKLHTCNAELLQHLAHLEIEPEPEVAAVRGSSDCGA